MNIPSFVGPLASALLFLLIVFGFCFYYCYIKPRRQRHKDAESNGTVRNSGSPSIVSGSCPTRVARKYSYEEECYSGLSPYSAGYCFHGGFPITAPYYEQSWQRPRKFQGPACPVVNVIKTGSRQKPKAQCGELRIDMIKEHCHGTVPKHCISRQLSTDSHGSFRNSCHLQVIQECEEEREENEEISEINTKELGEGCEVDNTCNNTCTVTA